MKLSIASLTILCLAAVLPASAQVLYDNGPIIGDIDAWTINFGYIVSDTFTLGNNARHDQLCLWRKGTPR